LGLFLLFSWLPFFHPSAFFLCFFFHKNLYDYVCDRLASWGKTDERIWSAPTAGGNRRAKWSSAWGLLLLLSHIGGIEMIGTKVAVEVEDEEAWRRRRRREKEGTVKKKEQGIFIKYR
jgi:hypothetical protein